MKKKKKLIIAFVVAIAIVCFLSFFFRNKTGVENLVEYSVDKIPDFTLTIGSTNRESILITKRDIIDRNVKVYEFVGKIDNNWKIVKNDYVGIRLLDIFNSYNIEYEDVEFYEVDSYSVKYKKSEINEDMFIVFFRDGKPVGNIEPVSMMSFRNKWNESLANINYIYIYEEPEDTPPISKEQQSNDSD